MLDTRYDGWFIGAKHNYAPGTKLSRVEPLLPNNGKKATTTIIVVNGIMTDANRQRSEMQALANTGAKVLGLHNATEGLVRDMGQVTTDKLGRGPNPAVDALKEVLRTELKAGRPVHLAGHSQGALIIARALKELQPELTPAQLKQLSVETYGGAARDYIDGPTYTHYMNRLDPAPWLLGVAPPLTHPGANAKDVWFEEVRVPRNLPSITEGVTNFFARVVDRMVHGAPEYYAHREP